jgi:hypothetical protein
MRSMFFSDRMHETSFGGYVKFAAGSHCAAINLLGSRRESMWATGSKWEGQSPAKDCGEAASSGVI